MKLRWSTSAVANLTIFGLVALAAALHTSYPDTYRRVVQEDQVLEWTTFWAFSLAALGYLVVARRQRRHGVRFPWFALGVALFCFFVAMEEISWAQRVFGYRPPDYFLEQNFQQELNVHNVFGTGLRKLILKAVILGYGVVLPLIAFGSRGTSRLERYGLLAPPWQLTPAFLGTYLLYEVYPWSHTGEWVELMLGLGFLLVAALEARRLGQTKRDGPRQLLTVVVAGLVAALLGFTTTVVLERTRFSDPDLIASAQSEVDALRRDFVSGRVESRCSLHKRLYTFMEKYDQPGLLTGEFAALVKRGLPEARAEFLLDPWNSPYWIRDWCKDGRRVTFIYSFGPDRARDSTRHHILGDDIGTFVRD